MTTISCFFDYKVWTQQHFESRLFWKKCREAENLRTLYILWLRSLHGQEAIGSVQCVILIDGLCDSELHRPDLGDTIGSFIAKHLESFPNWLKVLCTVRSSMTSVVKCLPFHQINLDKCSLDERIKKDLVDYVQYRIETSHNIQA